MKNFFRKLVAGTRRRFEEDGYDLDLTYIIPNRIIAMSYPAQGIESNWRNPIEKVSTFKQASTQNKQRRFSPFGKYLKLTYGRCLSFCKNDMGTNTGSSILRREQPTTRRSTLETEWVSITGQTTMDLLLYSFSRLPIRLILGWKVSTIKDSHLLFCWLADDENVVIVHCNSGKGRTGTAICALLLFIGYFDNVDDCLRFYGKQRFTDTKGVSQPC